MSPGQIATTTTEFHCSIPAESSCQRMDLTALNTGGNEFPITYQVGRWPTPMSDSEKRF